MARDEERPWIGPDGSANRSWPRSDMTRNQAIRCNFPCRNLLEDGTDSSLMGGNEVSVESDTLRVVRSLKSPDHFLCKPVMSIDRGFPNGFGILEKVFLENSGVRTERGSYKLVVLVD
jgi:hypothetical protein